MAAPVDCFPTGIVACECLTPLGNAAATAEALLAGRSALQLRPVLGRDGGDLVPLALIGGAIDETLPPRWLAPLRQLTQQIPAEETGWGSARFPVVVTSSNFGVGSMYGFM